MHFTLVTGKLETIYGYEYRWIHRQVEIYRSFNILLFFYELKRVLKKKQ